MSNKTSNFLSGFIIAVCLIFAYFAHFTAAFNDKMGPDQRGIFVIMMLAYAAFRGFRLYKNIQKQKES
ncbi:MAG: hypothetical protein ACOVO3_00515 [Fluviicola sp.]|jgi:hypothetical protein